MLNVRTDKAVWTTTWYCSKCGHCCIPSKHSTNLCKWRAMGYLTFQNLTESDVNEASRWQCLEHTISKVYARTGTNRFKNGCCENQSNGIHQRICYSSNDDWLMTVMNTNELKAEAERNHRLMDKVSNKDCPYLHHKNTNKDSIQSINTCTVARKKLHILVAKSQITAQNCGKQF